MCTPLLPGVWYLFVAHGGARPHLCPSCKGTKAVSQVFARGMEGIDCGVAAYCSYSCL